MLDRYMGDKSEPYSATPPSSPVDESFPLARAYVRNQRYTEAFPPVEALKQGTLFPELVRPYKKRMMY